ncbi:MAG TPA: GAF domain-containing sensor histidine kinase [Ktedonobacteraceae bacterium]|nr:GAF domain-containing sensor histidine kinase [Ktedonobacteraceae bacterium]
MSQKTRTLRRIPQTTLRRLRTIPTYFFLIWRWTWWFFALAWILLSQQKPTPLLPIVFLGITFLQSLVVTFYTPVFKIFLPELPWKKSNGASTPRQRNEPRTKREWRKIWKGNRVQPIAVDEEPEILPALVRSTNPYKDMAIYGLDVIICGLAMYFSAVYIATHFGNGSPFYRYGFAPVLVAGFAYRYRGGLAAAVGYDLFVLLGVFFPPPGAYPHYSFQLQDLLGSILDAPLVAILAAYMATLLNSITRNKRHEQDSVRRQRSLLGVSETLLAGASERKHFLRQSVKQIRKGGHFGYLIIAIIGYGGDDKGSQPQIDTYVESGVDEETTPDENEALVEQVARSGEKLKSFEPLQGDGEVEPDGMARFYLPFMKEGQVYMVLGAASIRKTPFEERQENYLKIVGALLAVALENIRLTEQAADLAAAAERGRIAREIHDGVAQLIYMLSLNSETCATLLQRIADTSGEEAELLLPVTERLDKVVTISKQALWETRHYMFTLKPLMSGTTTLTQMLTNQLREFEAISGLPAHLEVEGVEASPDGDQRRTRKTAQVGTAIFRITQEALTNAYKHADATQVQVRLHHLEQCIEVEINDDGKGVYAIPHSYDLGADGEKQRIYSGHGMRGMRERAEELGGTFEVRQGPTGGTSIVARIPI